MFFFNFLNNYQGWQSVFLVGIGIGIFVILGIFETNTEPKFFGKIVFFFGLGIIFGTKAKIK